MFHHFHKSNDIIKMNGSISESRFVNILRKANKNVIFTFDDGLKSQFKIAVKYLDKYSHKGIFFLNSFQYQNTQSIDNETTKYIIKDKFKSDYKFYKIFFKHQLIKKINFTSLNYALEKKNYPFYSLSDIKFRYIRDNHKKIFFKVISNILKNFETKKKEIFKKLYFSKNDILKLSKKHEIGLHSHSHLNNCDKLSFKKQYEDFRINKRILEKIIKKKITTASFPKGKYNLNTLKALDKLNIRTVYLNTKGRKKRYNLLNIIGRTNANQLWI